MNIVIFGANGPTGRLLTEQALAAGHTVTAFTRHATHSPSVTSSCASSRATRSTSPR